MSKREVSLIVKAKDQASKSLEHVSDAVETLTTSSSDLAKQTDASGKKLGQLGAAAAKLKSIELVGASLEEITFQIEKSNVALNTQRSAFTRASADVAEYSRLIINATVKLDNLRKVPPANDASKKAIREYAKDVKSAEAEIEKLTVSLERARVSQSAQAGNLRTSTANIEAMNTMAQKLRASLDADGNSAARLAEQLQKIARARAEIAAKRSFAAAPKTQDVPTLSTDPSAQVRKLRTDYQAAIATLSALQAQFRSAKSPTVEMGTALGEQRARVIALHAAYETLRTQAAQRISQDRELAERTRQHSEMLQRAADQRARDARESAANARLQAAADRLRADALRRSGLEMDNVTRNTRQMNRELNTTQSETRQTSQRLNGLIETLQRLAGGTRTSLNLFQRMRGQILAVGASYVGVFGAANLVSGIFDAQRQMDQIMGKFAVAFQGDEQKAVDEFEFTKQVANELGLDLRNLADDYSKLAIATSGTNLAGKKTRDIFIGVAQAARVQNLSAEETQGVFRALTQVISKGAVMSEELKDQIGERLPGAMKIMAEATGMTSKQLLKMMEQGDLSAEAIVNFAHRLSEVNAGGVKSASERAAASLERVKSAWFELQVALGESGFMDSVGMMLEELVKVLRDPQVIAAIQKFGAAMGDWTKTIVEFVRAHPEEVLLGIKTLALALGSQVIVGGLLNFKNSIVELWKMFSKLIPLFKKLGLPGMIMTLASALGTLYAIMREDESDKVANGVERLTDAYEDLGNAAQQARMKAGWVDEIESMSKAAAALREEIAAAKKTQKPSDSFNYDESATFYTPVVTSTSAKEQELVELERKIRIREVAIDKILKGQLDKTIGDIESEATKVTTKPDDYVATDGGEARKTLLTKIAKEVQDAELKFKQLLAKDSTKAIDDALALEKDAIRAEYDAFYKELDAAGLKRDGAEAAVIEKLIAQRNLLAEQRAEADKLALQRGEVAAAEAKANELLSYRQKIQERIEFLKKNGNNTEELENLRNSLSKVNDQLRLAITKAIELNQKLGTPEGNANVLVLQMQLEGLEDTTDKMVVSARDIDMAFVNAAVNGVTAFGEALGEVISQGGSLSDVFLAARDAFRQFAAEFLKKIAYMILEAAIFNAIDPGSATGVGGKILGWLTGSKHHEGGIIGSGGSPTLMSPGWFANAQRYHTGGIIGLKPNEVPIIGEKGEEVLTRQDARHSANGGGGSSPVQVKVINTIDSASVINEAMSTSAGQTAIVNAIRANKSSIKAVLT